MPKTLAQKLAVGGKTNSLGLAEEVVNEVLHDETRLGELYNCLFEPDAWLRMRAADSLEKVCRAHPEWFEPYVERLLRDMAESNQPSLQWHLAQMFGTINLTLPQKNEAVSWLKGKLKDNDADWIVAANAMTTLTQFARENFITKEELIPLLKIQQGHHSQAVRKRAAKLLHELNKVSYHDR